jgi:hypothetical protein
MPRWPSAGSHLHPTRIIGPDFRFTEYLDREKREKGMKKKAKDSPQPTNVLYVVLHGLITLVDIGEDGFLAYLMDMGKEHKYLAGDWLLEKKIKRGAQVQLINVDCGDATLSEYHNAIVTVPSPPSANHEHVHALIALPRPVCIHYFVRGNVKTDTLMDTSGLKKRPQYLSSIRIFEYTFTAQSDVRLVFPFYQGTLWQCPTLAQTGERNVAVLHIYDLPGASMDDPQGHNINEFNKAAAFLGDKVRMRNAAEATDPDVLLPGMLPGETACLVLRHKDALNLLRHAREKRISSSTDAGGCGSETCAGCNAEVG